MKDQLDGQIMKQLASLRAKTYSYLTDNSNWDKKANGNKRFVIKRKTKYKVEYQFLINKQESAGLNNFNNSKVFIEYSS